MESLLDRREADTLMAMEDHVAAYRRDGVTRIPQVFSADEVNALRSSVYLALTKIADAERAGGPAALQIINRSGTPSPALLFWPATLNAVVDKFRMDPRLIRIVTSVIGPDTKQLNNQFYFRLPGDGDSFAWHQDVMFRSPRSEYPGLVDQDAYLQTAIIIDPMRAANGGVEYVLGSHKLGDLHVVDDHNFSALRGFEREVNAAKFNHLPTKLFDADPGDVIIWSSLIVHGSQPNRSSGHRSYLMNGFAKAECCRPWPWYTKGGELQPLDTNAIPR